MSSGYDYKKYAVLYVDDELQSLKYFPRLFGDDLRCLTAASVADARELIASPAGESIGVVLSDQRMPGATGVELLSWLRATRPQVVRILTTAHSDLDSAIDAVNSGAIFRYVVKPWEERDLRGILLRAMEFHLIQRERDALLREKLTVLQRLAMLDRARGLAVVAAGLGGVLRNPLHALRTFLADAPPMAAVAAQGQVAPAEAWRAAQQAGERMLQLAGEVVSRTVAPSAARFLPVRLDQVVAAIGCTATLAPGTPAVAADADLLGRALRLLAGCVRRAGASDPVIDIAGGASLRDLPAVRVRLRVPGGAWNDGQLGQLFAVHDGVGVPGSAADLLAAYFLIHHHSGTLTPLQGADGAGFEVLLPVDAVPQPEARFDADDLEALFGLADG